MSKKNLSHFFLNKLEPPYAKLMSDAKNCTFSEHAICASHIIRSYEWSNRKACPLECNGYRFHKHTVQVNVADIIY